MKSFKEYLKEAGSYCAGYMPRKVSKPPAPKTDFEKKLAARYKGKSTLQPVKENVDRWKHVDPEGKISKHPKGSQEWHRDMAAHHGSLAKTDHKYSRMHSQHRNIHASLAGDGPDMDVKPKHNVRISVSRYRHATRG